MYDKPHKATQFWKLCVVKKYNFYKSFRGEWYDSKIKLQGNRRFFILDIRRVHASHRKHRLILYRSELQDKAQRNPKLSFISAGVFS